MFWDSEVPCAVSIVVDAPFYWKEEYEIVKT